MRSTLVDTGSALPPGQRGFSKADSCRNGILPGTFRGQKGAQRKKSSGRRLLDVKTKAEAAVANQELAKRLEDSPGCSTATSSLESGILEVLLKELNEKGRLYRDSAYVSNAVEKPDELRVHSVDSDTNASHRQATAQGGLHSPVLLPQPTETQHLRQQSGKLQQQGTAMQRSSPLEDEDEESLGELTSSGDILGEDNMFTGGEDLQNKGKARKRGIVQAKQRVSSERPANGAIVADFVSQLRSYRSLKSELSAWTTAFLTEHGRAPHLIDVEQTCSPQLEAKFREFLGLRSVIFDASQNLRGKLESNALGPSGNASHREVVNANGSAGSSMGQGASRLAKALEYKQKRLQPASSNNEAAASAEQSKGAASSSVMHTTEKANFKAPTGMVSASARVKIAMLAAAKYKKQVREQAIAAEGSS